MKRRFRDVSSPRVARGFIAAATALSLGCIAVALASFLAGDLEQGLLVTAIAIFAAWMVVAIHQFQSRISGIDEVVRQARQRVEQSDQTLAEMRQLAQRLRASSSAEDSEENRTIH
ncbi:MAG: hypothetical protein ACREQ9_10990 [Candidatus Binatia bacterium]